MNEIENNETQNKTEVGKMDYHKEYFTTKQERDERIITLIDEDCRVEKEKSDSEHYEYCIGIYVSL